MEEALVSKEKPMVVVGRKGTMGCEKYSHHLYIYLYTDFLSPPLRFLIKLTAQ